MSFLSNAHTHTTWCDGKSSAEELIAAAQRLGFVSLGFSGHADQGFDDEYAMADGKQEQYRLALRKRQQEALEAHAAPRLWVGIELDMMVDERKTREAFEHFDYVIGATHYFDSDYGGEPVAVDGDPALLKRYVDDVFHGDGLWMARAYYEMLVSYLLIDRPQIIAHFDCARKNAEMLSLFDERGAAYRKLALDALERAFPCGGVLEVNTGGMARGKMKSPYPTLELLGAWRELGGKTTITSDCHDARYLDYRFDLAEELLRRAGYKSVLRLGTGDALWEEISL